MADISDVTAYLAQQAYAAVYPNGSTQPSIAPVPTATAAQTFTNPADVRIFEGWPLPDQLDLDLAGMMMNTATPPVKVPRPKGAVPNVSIFPMQGTGVSVYQNLDNTYTIAPPAITTTFVLVGNVITVSGALSIGEYLTLVIDGAVVCSQSGSSVSAMLAALATQAQGFGYAATSTSTTLTIPFGHELVVRQGGVGILGKATHRQRQSIMVTVWAPNQATRATLAKAIDNLIKQTIRVSMPDTSQAIILYNRTNIIDEQQSQTIYRRDLIYDAEYATVEQFPGYLITSTQTSIANPSNTAIATATT